MSPGDDERGPIQAPSDYQHSHHAAATTMTSVNDGWPLPEGLRRRRDAAAQLAPLSCGCRDPRGHDHGVAQPYRPDPCGSPIFVTDPVEVVRLTCSAHHCRGVCQLSAARRAA
jgi:hypothetical protein